MCRVGVGVGDGQQQPLAVQPPCRFWLEEETERGGEDYCTERLLPPTPSVCARHCFANRSNARSSVLVMPAHYVRRCVGCAIWWLQERTSAWRVDYVSVCGNTTLHRHARTGEDHNSSRCPDSGCRFPQLLLLPRKIVWQRLAGTVD